MEVLKTQIADLVSGEFPMSPVEQRRVGKSEGAGFDMGDGHLLRGPAI